METKKRSARQLPPQKILPLAMAAALAYWAPVAAQAAATFTWNAGDLGLPAGESITGNTTAVMANGSLGTLTNSGTISGTYRGIFNNSGSISTLSNGAGGIITGSAPNGIGIDNNNGTIDSLSNNGGTISGGSSGLGLYNEGGVIGTLSNSGTISAGSSTIYNSGTIGTLNNSGVISGGGMGLGNGGTIHTLSNTGTISGGFTGIGNGGSIGTLSNSGSISGNGSSGISNSGGRIDTLSNTGTISGSSGIYNMGTITTLDNGVGGVITGANSGVINSGTIGTLSNSGTISAGSSGNAIYNSGTIGTLSNSGTLTGTNYVIMNDASGTIGAINNTGIIAGDIRNDSANALTINGGTGSNFGTLTGLGAYIGNFYNASANVVFGSGNLLLNDNIRVGTNTVINSSATLQINNPLTITGNYSQGAGATLLLGVSSGAVTNGTISSGGSMNTASATDSGYGRLTVTGSATIASGSSVGLKSLGYVFASGQRYVVVDAASTGTNYNEGSLHYSATGYTGAITGANVTVGSRSELVLTLSTASASSGAGAASSPDAVSSLTGISGYTGLDPNLMNLQNAAAAAANSGPTAANNAGKQLAPSQTGMAGGATQDAMGLTGGRLGGIQSAQADGHTGLAAGDSPRDWSLWGQALGGHADQNQTDSINGYSANYGGFLIGADRGYGDAWRTGAAFTYSNTLASGSGATSGSSTRVNAYGLMGYLGYTGEPWYLNLSGALVRQNFNTARLVNMTGFNGEADASFNGMQYAVRAEAGYPLKLNATYTLTPLLGLGYSSLQQDAYTETGGSGAALAVDASHTDSAQSTLGARIQRSYATSQGELQASFQAQWVHEYMTRQTTSARFVADTTGETRFSSGAAPIADYADISVGVTLPRSKDVSISLRYGIQAADGFLAQTGMIRWQRLF